MCSTCKSITTTQINNIIFGCTNLFPIAGAIISDSFFGSFSVITIFAFVSLLVSCRFFQVCIISPPLKKEKTADQFPNSLLNLNQVPKLSIFSTGSPNYSFVYICWYLDLDYIHCYRKRHFWVKYNLFGKKWKDVKQEAWFRNVWCIKTRLKKLIFLVTQFRILYFDLAINFLRKCN